MEDVMEKARKERQPVETNTSKPGTRKIEVAADAAGSENAALKMKVDGVCAWFGEKQALYSVNMDIHEREVTAIIGPSGCGKSTLIRCFNRMHETVPGSRFDGDIQLEGKSIYDPQMDPVYVRRRIGMVFQKATPFPTLSIYDNVAIGLRLNNATKDKKVLDETVAQPAKSRPLGRGEGQYPQTGSGPLRRSATAPLHRPGPGGGPGSAPDGRALLGLGSHLDLQDRGIDP